MMAGFFFVCADLGLTYDFIWRSAEAWRNRCDELLADNNWRANHNFRASTIVLLAATESCAPTLTGAQRVKDYMSAHISRTLHSVDRNRIEEDRERSIHYALLEMWSASIVGMWLDKFGLALAPSTTSEIRNYLNFLLPKAKIALSVDPKPGGITFTFLSDTGHAMQEIGPVIKQLWGPVWEACLLLRWTTIPCPQSLRWHNAVYKTYARVPQR